MSDTVHTIRSTIINGFSEGQRAFNKYENGTTTDSIFVNRVKNCYVFNLMLNLPNVDHECECMQNEPTIASTFGWINFRT